MLKSYLINLARSDDRLAQAREEFCRVGVDFVRIVGVDGGLLPNAMLNEFARQRRAMNPMGWLPGEVGCFLSHFAVWERIAASDDAWAAVFEDDVRIASDLHVLLESGSWIPAEADIVRLEANKPMRLNRGIPIAGTTGRSLHEALSGTWGSAGYVIAKHSAERLIKTPPTQHTSVDVFLFKPKMSRVAKMLRRYQVVPAVCIQDGVLEGHDTPPRSLIRKRFRRGKNTYREHVNPVRQLWPIRRYAVPFRS